MKNVIFITVLAAFLSAPVTASATTLYRQPAHDQVAYTAPASTDDSTFWTTMRLTLSGAGQPRYWWLYGALPKDETTLVFGEPNAPITCTLRFEQTLSPEWVRAYALPVCANARGARVDLPTYGADYALSVAWLGSLGAGGALYGGGEPATGACKNEITGSDGACTAPPALFVTDDAAAVPEPAVPVPYNDTATHLVGTYYYADYHFTKANSPYVVDGPVYFRYGNITIDPGVVFKFRNAASSLMIHNADVSFTNLATREEPVYFTSYRDDTHGGDTNGDGTATSPAPGDWGYVSLPCRHFAADYLRIFYGGSAAGGNPALNLCAQGGVYESFTYRNLEIAYNRGGLSLFSGPGTGWVTDSSFHDNVDFAARTQTAPYVIASNSLTGNWWGSENGPRSADNPGGTGDIVQGDVPTVPFLTADPFAVPPPRAAAPSVANLRQFREFGVDEIAPGAGFIGNAVVLKADVADADSTTVMLEVELKKADESFDGTNLHATTTTITAGATTTIAIPIDELISLDDQYSGNNHQAFHWRARAVDAEGNASEWQEFAPAADSFTANVVPLWTQGRSSFPSDDITRGYAGEPYAAGSCVTIAACGCGIASIVMIARYYGVDTDLEGKEVNPLNINAWLEAHDGYAPGGLIKWDKVAKEYLGIRQSDDIYQRLALTGFRISPSAADDILAETHPVIIRNEDAYHFLVATSKIGRAGDTTYLVRDPSWYNTRTLNDTRASFVRPYNNHFDYAIVYTKLPEPQKVLSFSSVEFYLASPAELLFTDALGRRVGTDPATGISYDEIPGAHYYRESSYESSEFDVDPAGQHEIKVLTLPDAPDGAHELVVIGTGAGTYTLTAHLQTNTGEVTKRMFTASTTPGKVTAYQLAISGDTQTVTTDTTPPEARIGFDVVSQKILITGTDDTSSTTVTTTATSSIITDEAGNTLLLTLSHLITRPSYASLTIPFFSYSSGTTTNATTTVRYFWTTNKKGKYTLFISAIRTPTARHLSLYSALSGKTYVLTTTPADDIGDLSLRPVLLMLRQKIATYSGLKVFGIATERGGVVVQ